MYGRINNEVVQYVADLYIRLSEEDECDGLSSSCKSQEMTLKDYCYRNKIIINRVLTDDGWSGTNFDRPAFIEVQKDINQKKINTVVVKDLSRLGRENLETGSMIEEFAKNNIYFIAVLDGVDTRNNMYDRLMVPFKNLINGLYPIDVSEKVKLTFKVMAEKGYFFGSYAPYGYQIDPNDKHHLIVDEEVAWIVKYIYKLYLEGHGFGSIASIMEKEKINTPSEYHFKNHDTYHCRSKNPYRGPYDWHITSIRSILTNSVYKGEIVNGKTERTKIGSKKGRKIPPEFWIRKSHMHEPIVSEEDFAKVQYMISHKARMTANGHKHMFAGLVKCSDCGAGLNLGGRNKSFTCYTYKTFGKDKCTSHNLKYDDLEKIVMDDIKKKITEFKRNEKGFIQEFLKNRNLRDTITVPIDKLNEKRLKRINEIKLIQGKLYEDYALSRIDEEVYDTLRTQYLTETQNLKAEAKSYWKLKEKEDQEKEGIYQFMEVINKYVEFDKMNSDIIHDLVDKIVVYQAVGTGENKKQRIEIHYRFIGEY